MTSSSKSFKNEYLVNSTFTGKEIDLFELLSMVPEIWKEFNSFNNEQVYVNGEPYVLLNNTNEVLCFRFLKSSLPKDLNKLTSKISDMYQFGETQDNIFFQSGELKLPRLKCTINNEILYPIIETEKLSDLHLYYLIFFILGSIARYRPNTWDIIINSENQKYKNVMETLAETSSLKIPLLVLSEIEDKLIKL